MSARVANDDLNDEIKARRAEGVERGLRRTGH